MTGAEPLSASQRGPAVLRRLAWATLGLAVAYFAWRGAWRALLDSQDLTVGYAAARGWLLGHDPYLVVSLKSVLLEAGGGALATGDLLDGLRNVYFPTSLPVFLAIAIVSWPNAVLLMLALNVAASLLIATGLVRILGWHWTSGRALGLVAFVIALGPLHLTMSLGQTGILATAGIVAALLLERSGHRVLAGALYGLATAVKVQIGLPFVAYLLWRGRWATAWSAVSVIGGLTALSVLRMHVAGVPWFDSWQQNVALLLGPGGVNDSGPLNPERYSLINLQYPLSYLVPGGLANVLSVAAVGGGATAMVWLIRGRHPRNELLAISIVSVLGLLVTYHRYYDAVLLALPIAWAFSVLGTAEWRQGAIVLVLSLDFVVPILGAMRNIQQEQILPSSVTDSLLWQFVVMPLHTWVLVAMGLVMLWAATQQRRRLPGPRELGRPHPPEATSGTVD